MNPGKADSHPRPHDASHPVGKYMEDAIFDGCIPAARERIAPPADETSSKPGSRPERVLYVVSLFPSWSETFIVREIQTLVNNGIDVRVLSLRRASDSLVHADAAALMDRVRQPQRGLAAVSNTLRALFGDPTRLAAAAATIVTETWRTPVVLLKSLVAMARAMEQLPWVGEFSPQFIHAHWSTTPSTAAWVLSKTTGIPFGFTCHAHDVFVNHHMLARKIDEAALAVTISRHNVDWLSENISPRALQKLQIVHCGVDMSQIDWRPGPEGREGSFILGVGRLSPEKGFDTLIEALALLKARGTLFNCTLVGEGPARSDLQKLIDSHGLDGHVKLAGKLPQEAVRTALDSATVFVLPCQIAANGSRDGIPVALMEAMAAGCPVVSCPVSGVPELIRDGVSGLLAPEKDPAALSLALHRLLHDEALRRRLSIAARRCIEADFDARKEAIKLQRLISGVLADAA